MDGEAREQAAAETIAGLDDGRLAYRPKELASGATPYALRHSFCSPLLAEGRSIIEVARQLGHGPT